MDYADVTAKNGQVLVRRVRHFDLDTILDCGQCFRWERLGEKRYGGIACGHELTVAQYGDTLLFERTTPEEFYGVWHAYFDFGREYGPVKELLRTDAAMAAAVDFCPGMRVVRQDPWEALCSFIISQNNNIPRIRGIVERLCACFGAALPGGGRGFPPPEALAGKSAEDLAPLRSGFRAKYLLDAARLAASGALDLNALYTMELGEARARLRRINGVGPKVAECALLYGFGRAQCFPVDVWIGRAMAALYPDGFPAAFAPVAGLAQQYLFHYMRNRPRTACDSA